MRLCDCGKPHRARGMCHACYERWRRGNPLDVDNRSGRWIMPDGSRAPCMSPDCTNPILAQGLCSKHLQQFYYQDRRNNA